MRVIGAALATILFLSPALAEGWVFRSGEVGYVAKDDAFAGLWLACGPSGDRLSVATGKVRLPAGVDQAVVVDVDNTAYLHRMRFGEAEGGAALSRSLPRAETRVLAEALAKGRRAEVSTPVGRFTLPLNGSGKALQAFLASCP